MSVKLSIILYYGLLSLKNYKNY